LAESEKAGTARKNTNPKATVTFKAKRIGVDIIPPILFAFGSQVDSALLPDWCAAATRYHAGHRRAQLNAPERPPLNVGSINIVIANASRIAKLSFIGAILRPRRAPRSAAGKKRNRETQDRNSIRNVAKQERHGNAHKAPLTQSVRRDTDAATKPPAHEQANSRKTWHTRCARSGSVVSRPPSRKLWRVSRTKLWLRETEAPIRRKLFGTVRPNPARQGR